MSNNFKLNGKIAFRLSEIKLGDVLFPEIIIDIKPGINIVTAPSGKGKTTLISRIIGLRGEPEYRYHDNISFQSFSFSQIKDNIAYLSQDNIILGESLNDALNYFRTSFIDNIFFRRLLNNFQIDFLSEHPNTIMFNDNSIQLSGGQIRKTLILQTLLQDKLFYIFDEPTSSFDSESTKIYFENIKNILHDKYCLIITHDKIVESYNDFNFINL
jgi:ABC-type transport system involved in cytochrome bd biosynthesis fused ATPase/permease subunit